MRKQVGDRGKTAHQFGGRKERASRSLSEGEVLEVFDCKGEAIWSQRGAVRETKPGTLK